MFIEFLRNFCFIKQSKKLKLTEIVLNKEDVLVLSTERVLAEHQKTMLKEIFDNCIKNPEAKIFICDGGLQMTVIKRKV
jgi:hypothetical protein